ncbi:MAG: folate family ECF transporter S component [Ruminococcus sp.]|nr:folate family ECF transporter S component [Ruminococcus sp.]MCD7800296.1 folate family ECF transporter S component [Ruminococcus sp.]
MYKKSLIKQSPVWNLRTMVVSALLIALSIVLGKQLSLTVGAFRISFENLPILIAGIFFNPVMAIVVGGISDIVGCLVVGYSINPIITIGAILVGGISGMVSNYCMKKDYPLKLRLILSVGTAHIIGSVIVKSVGLYVYYHYAIPILLLRIPLYVLISIAEIFILHSLSKNRLFMENLESLKNK